MNRNSALLPQHWSKSTVILLLLASCLGLSIISHLTTPHMTIATLAYLFLCAGLLLRKTNTKAHASLMTLGIGTDLALVAILEAQRNAIDTAMQFSLTPMQQLHIGASSIAVLFYFPVLALGILRYTKKIKGKASKKWHMRLGIAAFAFRTAGFILMFFLISHVKR